MPALVQGNSIPLKSIIHLTCLGIPASCWDLFPVNTTLGGGRSAAPALGEPTHVKQTAAILMVSTLIFMIQIYKLIFVKGLGFKGVSNSVFSISIN